MSDFSAGVLFSLYTVLLVFLGWTVAFVVAAGECRKHGTLYVLNTAYQCSVKEPV